MTVIEFPGPDLPSRPDDIDKLHGEAFRELETNLRDCLRMVSTAAQLMFDASIEDDQLRFTVFHSAEMLKRLEKEYDASWRGELRSDQ
ncbi:hypothetical protein Q2941_45840 [Bradyrhizobium sp. UFLA05-153]